MEVKRDIGRKIEGEGFCLWKRISSVLKKMFLTIFIFIGIKTKFQIIYSFIPVHIPLLN